MDLRNTFLRLVNQYTIDNALADNLWIEVERSYSSKKRHYHNLFHLDHLLGQLLSVREFITNWDAVLFALYYHDVVYDVLKKNNEEKSALLAEKRLTALQIPRGSIESCTRHILATRVHHASDDSDTNFFTDADLSILGADWNAYNTYRHQVRKEYSVYPDMLYKPGRRKVLKHFLQMERIFKTDPFFDKYENSAKLNLEKELIELE
jgi:predicted metal-dependent HD superfamily phosphohydrolase